ncbi:hypothetical protein [Mucilaginibacter sp.]|uniref:WapI family immunity protein n=1 Tax=Mucilaginibacter sp. TaxID=1882438 RepID=UPI0025F49076|nr:hypothetical protein [Mucilaginibacter sp.]
MKEKEELFFELNINGDSITMIPLKIINYNSELSWDNNWIKTQIIIKVGGFKGDYTGEFMVSDFLRFRDELKVLYTNLDSSAKFSGYEGYLEIDIKGDGTGHLNAACVAVERSATLFGSELKFELAFDQTYIPGFIKQLDDIANRFPVIK